MTQPKLDRRAALTIFGAAGVASIATWAQRAWAACNLTAPQTEGPFWNDDRLHRSDIRSDPTDGTLSPGVPLQLQINVLRADADCAGAPGLFVDVWQCDAAGRYSGEPSNGTTDKKFLRGYQVTGANGAATFTTIYPGWYSGRTIHIHLRVRAFNGTAVTYNFASQLYFDDAISDQVLAQPPYNSRGPRNINNRNDGIFNANNLARLSADGSGGYLASFDVALNGLPAGLPLATATATAVATLTPKPTPADCHGDCDGDGAVSVDEVVRGVNIALENTELAVCPQLDADGSGSVTVEEIVKAVDAALSGCS